MRSASVSQQWAEPGGVQATQPEAPEAEGAVVEVQTQTAQQLNDGGSFATLHAHSQSPAEVLLVDASAEQELHQIQRTASLTHLKETAQRSGLGLIIILILIHLFISRAEC